MSYYHDNDDYNTVDFNDESSDFSGYNKQQYLEVNPLHVELKRGSNKIQVYASKQVGTNIVNALTGRTYSGMKVGNICENDFYKVMISTGESVRVINTNIHYQLKTPLTLFYENKDDFYNQFMLDLPEE
jgi:hypothetical protein